MARGALTIDDIRRGLPATRALLQRQESPVHALGMGNVHEVMPGGMARFLVEIPVYTVEAFVRFGFIRSDQQDDVAAIMGALRRLGQAPAVSRIA
jgi:UDP-N-acetylglucosamine:LPS N-acetylglucosamine transferase